MSVRTADTSYAGQVTPANGSDETVLEDSYSVIDRHSNFDGTFRSSRDLRIEGEVKGTIECQGTLFVAEGASVSAKVEAENITVAGDLNGEVRCLGRLQIMPSGQVRGKVTTATLVINEGAFYEGQLEMVPPDQRNQRVAGPAPRVLPPKPVAPPVTLPAASSEASAPAGGGPSSSGTSAASTFIRRLGAPETPWESRSEDEPASESPDESVKS